FVLTGCDATPVVFTVTYPGTLPAGTQYYKFGPTTADPAPHWYILPATFGPTSVTFSITDGSTGDDDMAVNGTIVDQGGPGVPGAVLNGIPPLSDAMLALMALLLGALGIAGMRGAALRRRRA